MKNSRAMIIIGIVLLFWCTAAGQPLATDPAPGADAAAVTGAAPDASGDPAAMTDIHDIKPLVAVPLPVSLATVLLLASACLLAAAGLLGAWFLWNRRRRAPVETLEAQLSPEDKAFQQLAVLSADAVDGKAYYFQLSAIFREYLQGRFGIDGLEMTTEELLPRVETMALERELKLETKAFLAACDPVKFAGAPTQREAMEKDRGFVRGFVEKTVSALSAPEDSGEPVDPTAME